MTLPSDPAQRHRAVAARFADLAEGVTDWDAPTPVAAWRARDVVDHLTTWLPGFLHGAGVEWGPAVSVADDPVGAWDRHCRRVQALLDDPGAAQQTVRNPAFGEVPLPQAVDRFYVTDVFLHSWDLARSSGQAPRLDPDFCEQLLEGLSSMGEALVASGHYGPAVAVPADAPVEDRLAGLIGRDPGWRP